MHGRNEDKKILKTAVHSIVLLILLAGCKAQEVELQLSTNQISEAIQGNSQKVRFQAEFALISEYNDEIKRTIRKVQEISEKYFEVEEFDVTQGDFGLKIEVEGLVPLLGPDSTKSMSPWVLKIHKNAERGALAQFSHKLIFAPTSTLDSYLAEIQAVNLMLSPARYQPVKFKIRNKSNQKLRIFTGGVEVDGESKALYEANVANRISLSMNGGVYDKTSPVIYLNLN